jgi:formylglycine-generating enzyme required for sulfatase activity
MMGIEGTRPEGPVRPVTLTKGFWIGQYEVTQPQYQAVMGTNPSHFRGDTLPVENVNWMAAKEFCKKLSQKESKTYALPTEAQWEYVCRAGTTTEYSYGSVGSNLYAYGNPGNYLDDFGWYRNNSDQKTHPVGQKKPNPWGLYDIHGNVWEWCSDWYAPYYAGMQLDPCGSGSGTFRVLRGGSWCGNDWFCGSAFRYGDLPDTKDSRYGFRIVCLDF